MTHQRMISAQARRIRCHNIMTAIAYGVAELEAAKPPTIAQDTSIMDDLAEIVALGDGLCEPPRRGPAGHWTERSFMDANREPFPEVPEPEIKEPFEDESTNHGF